MKFKDKIRLHQQEEYDFAAELLNLAQSEMVKTVMVRSEVQIEVYNKDIQQHEIRTFIRWKPTYIKKKNTPEYHIAYNLKAFLSRHAKKAKAIKKTVNVGLKEQKLLFDAEDFLYTSLTKMGYHYHVDDYHKISKNVLKKIENNFGEDYQSWITFERLYMDYINVLRSINKEIEKLHNQISPLILESLYEVIPLIDLERTEEEIIGFMTLAVKNRTYRKLTKVIGNKVHNIKGEKYYVNTSKMQMKQSNMDRVLGVNDCKLTSNQILFYNELKKVIQVEIDKRNTVPFTFDSKGEIIRINKKYFAEKLNMEQSAFKHRLKRLQDKKNKDFFAKKIG